MWRLSSTKMSLGLPSGFSMAADDVDVGKVVALVGESFDLRIEFGLGGDLGEAQLRGLGGDEPHRRLAQCVVLEPHEEFEVGVGVGRRPAGVDVVLAGVEDDGLRMIGLHRLVEIPVDLGDGRAAEAAVDHLAVGEVFLQRAPEADRGRADEEEAASWRHRRLVGSREGRHRLFVAQRRRLGDDRRRFGRAAGGKRKQRDAAAKAYVLDMVSPRSAPGEEA